MSLLSISHLSKKYGEIRALTDFSLEMKRGDVVALVGPDGAGKTTLMRTVCNLLTPDEGEIIIDGHNVAEQFERVKSIIGYMPQIFSLYPDLSVEENLRFYSGIYGHTGAAYRKRRDELYEFSRLGSFAGRRAGALSGGMKQKLALSCALLHNPQLLILDEPTTGVDPLSRRYFWEMLLKLKADGVTILVSTPYMDEANRSDRTVCLLDGKTLAEGSPEQLASQYEGQVYYSDQEPTTDMVHQLSQLEGLQARRFGAGLQVQMTDSLTPGKVADRLRSLGVDPERLEAVSATLEDRFIQMMEESL